ncbi:regulatory protein RecX [Leucobacter soli]|uniref:regulatory protein RecX n=1 Tax=Leucobacter soli TaxID=2812850 RepID=UPI00361A7DF9
MRLLARKARSTGEFRRELIGLGHDVQEAEAVALEFESSLYLDDLGLARTVAQGLRERKRASRMQIRMKLRERLLPDGVIEEALGELDEDEEGELLIAAAEARAARLGGLDRQTAERRLLGFLARRGWSGERAARAACEALDRGPSADSSEPGRGPVRFR